MKGQGIYAFVTLLEGVEYSDDLRRSLIITVRNQVLADGHSGFFLADTRKLVWIVLGFSCILRFVSTHLFRYRVLNRGIFNSEYLDQVNYSISSPLNLEST